MICTNGTFPLVSSVDYIWVSLDGIEIEHNTIRGSFYEKVINNIKSSKHKGIYINLTISKSHDNLNMKHYSIYATLSMIRVLYSVVQMKGFFLWVYLV